MTSLQHPQAIRHFQSLCDACQELTHRYHSPSELRLYADGYLHALRRCEELDPRELAKLETLIDRWILDPSSFIGPNGDVGTLFRQPELG
ncbi:MULTISPECIES: DUF6761 family protein [unclassified Synechococcus]|uniref:DUF6761 family protein n=1 Tax=unclassified Synechococcus TaxID=2626047 RepID=UPI000B749EBD|nr:MULTISPECIES: DUF6761 family protein [unclassified Synechococcus]MAS28944.1 hypothetical protein [Synechococcus sp. NAT40]OUW48830.1 MAG: hypothetical protein CBD47_02485 [Synechococcus sp. TMED187]RZO14785.1 MAG: hypothetical protein EVB08_01875 [Synechococcus sp. MED-G135]